MGYHEAMDIRGIAWAGYFFAPGAVSPPIIFGDGPEMEGEVIGSVKMDATLMRPGLGGEDTSIKPPQMSASESTPDVIDADELKPEIRT